MALLSNIPVTNGASALGIAKALGGGSNPYFTAQDRQISFLGGKSSPYTKLVPAGNGVVNIYNDLYWCNPASDKSEVPQIYVVEKELQYGAWATQLSNLLTQSSTFLNGVATAANIAKGGKAITSASSNTNVDTFVQLYAAQNTGFYYNFPWLLKNGDSIRDLTSSWNSMEGMAGLFKSFASSESNSNGLDGLAAMGAGAVVGAMTPGFGFEDTKQYESTSQNSVTVTFPLYNTIDIQSAFHNFCFVNLFTFQNMKTRTSLMTFIPPKIYEVDAFSLGGLYMAAAYVSHLKIDSIGTTRRMSDFASYGASEILIPEAYRVTITFTDLLSQSSNVFAGALGGSKLSITNADVSLQNLGQDFKNLANAGLNIGQAGLNLVGLKNNKPNTSPTQ